MERSRSAVLVVLVVLFGSCSSSDDAGNGIGKILSCLETTDGQQQCLDAFIAEYAGDQKTTKELLANLELARSEDKDVEIACHPIAHAIGRWTYLHEQNIADAFRACDATCHSGCFHGVVERALNPNDNGDGSAHFTLEVLKPIVPTLCEVDKLGTSDSVLVFQCLHGLGHAVLFSLEYDLHTALAACDLLESTYSKDTCYGGVFMENVTAFDEDARDINPDDPHHPCSGLDAGYRSACYRMQTSVMGELGLSDEEIGEACLGAGDWKSDCFISFGRDMSTYFRSDDGERAVRACEEYSPGHEGHCVRGVLHALIDNTHDGRFAYGYCAELATSERRVDCYRAANSYFQAVYGMSADAVRAECDRWAGEGRDTCVETI